MGQQADNALPTQAEPHQLAYLARYRHQRREHADGAALLLNAYVVGFLFGDRYQGISSMEPTAAGASVGISSRGERLHIRCRRARVRVLCTNRAILCASPGSIASRRRLEPCQSAMTRAMPAPICSIRPDKDHAQASVPSSTVETESENREPAPSALASQRFATATSTAVEPVSGARKRFEWFSRLGLRTGRPRHTFTRRGAAFSADSDSIVIGSR